MSSLLLSISMPLGMILQTFIDVLTFVVLQMPTQGGMHKGGRVIAWEKRFPDVLWSHVGIRMRWNKGLHEQVLWLAQDQR